MQVCDHHIRPLRAQVATDLDPDKIERLPQLLEEADAREVIATCGVVVLDPCHPVDSDATGSIDAQGSLRRGEGGVPVGWQVDAHDDR